MDGLEIVKKWNFYMADLLVTKSEKNPSPIIDELVPVFYHK
jgi:L-rhamnose mutarotase